MLLVVDTIDCPKAEPKHTLLDPVVLLFKAEEPKAQLLDPVVLLFKAEEPKAQLLLPVVFVWLEKKTYCSVITTTSIM